MKTRLIGALLAVVLAVVGTLVLTTYVRSAEARALEGAELVTVYLVTEEIPAGTEASEIGKNIAQKKIPRVGAVPGRVTNLAELAGQVSDVALLPGEQLVSARWVDPKDRAERVGMEIPDGMQSFTIALPVEQVVGGTITPGDTVGVVVSATLKPQGGDEVSLTKELFHKVLVLNVEKGTSTPPDDDATAAKTAETTYDTVMVTLARPTDDVQKIVWGQEFGSVWLTLEPEEADESGSRAVDGVRVFE